MAFRKLGVIMLVASIWLSFYNFTFTGAVIGGGAYSSLSFMSVFFFIAGVMMVLVSGTLEQRVESVGRIKAPSEIYSVINKNFPEVNKVFIADTSFLSTYLNNLEIVNFLKETGDLVVPSVAIKELGAKKELRPYAEYFKRVSVPGGDAGCDKYLNVARAALKSGSKPYYYDILKPHFEKGTVPQIDSIDREDYDAAIEHLSKRIEHSHNPKADRRDFLNRHYIPSEADAYILASAIKQLKEDKKIPIILERDEDFEDAIKYLNNVGFRGVHFMNVRGKFNK